MTEIYALFKDKEIVYIGRSKDADKRVRAHRKDKDFDNYMILCECSKGSERLVEDMFIKQFDPKYNKCLNAIGQYVSLSDFCEEHNIDKDFINSTRIYVNPVFGDNYRLHDIWMVAYQSEAITPDWI